MPGNTQWTHSAGDGQAGETPRARREEGKWRTRNSGLRRSRVLWNYLPYLRRWTPSVLRGTTAAAATIPTLDVAGKPVTTRGLSYPPPSHLPHLSSYWGTKPQCVLGLTSLATTAARSIPLSTRWLPIEEHHYGRNNHCRSPQDVAVPSRSKTTTTATTPRSQLKDPSASAPSGQSGNQTALSYLPLRALDITDTTLC